MKNINKIILSFSIAGVFLYFFLVFDVNFHGPDEPIYFAYTASIVDDGDMNVVNQVCSESGQFDIGILPTYNLPDAHNHGGVILWVPFYAYAKAAYSIATKFNLESLTGYGFNKLANCAMSFSTVALGFLVLLLTYFLCRQYFSQAISILSIFAIFLGTPFFYYMVFETGNSHIVGCLFSVISILFCSLMKDFRKRDWLLYGLFFSLCGIVRRELLLQSTFIVIFYIFLVSSKQINWKNGIYFLIGFILPFTLKIINNYLKYGVWPYTEEINYIFVFFYTLIENVNSSVGVGDNPGASFHFNGFFNSFRGIFYTSPVFYICIFGLVLFMIGLLKKIKNKHWRNQDIFFGALALYLALKLSSFIYSFNPAGESPAARLLIAEFPIFVLLFAQVLQKKYFVYLTLVSSLFLVLWNLLVISEFMAGLDWVYVAGTPGIFKRIGALKYILDSLFWVKDLGLKLKVCLPLVLIVLGITFYILRRLKLIQPPFWYVRDKNNRTSFKLIYLFAMYSCIAYLVVTLFNVSNNKRNAEKLKREGFFTNFKITQFSPITMIDKEEESRWWWFTMSGYYALKGDVDKVNEIQKLREEFFNKKTLTRVGCLPLRPYCNLIASYNTSGRYNKAIECYKKALELNPYNSDIYMELGDIYNIVGDCNKAIEAFEKAIQFNPSSINAYVRLADIYNKINIYDKTIEYNQQILKLRPNYADAYRNLGEIYSAQTKYDQAVEYYQRAIQANPDFAEAYRGLADTHIALANYDKAIECYKEALRLRPGSPDIYMSLVNIYSNQGNYPQAIEYITKAIQLNPKSADNYATLASIYQSQGDYTKAIEFFQKVIQLRPGSAADTYRSLGDVYATQGNYPKAIESYQQALKLRPGSLDIYMNLGSIYSSQGSYSEAIKCYQAAIRLNPNLTDAHSILGNIYSNKGNYPKAIESYQQALKLRPASADINVNLGDIYSNRGDYNKAIEYYQQALQLNPNYYYVHFTIGNVYSNQGKYDKAIEHFEKCNQLNPNNNDASRRLAEVYSIKAGKESKSREIKKLKN